MFQCFTWKTLNSADSALISSETTLNSADFWWTQKDNFWFSFQFFFVIFRSTSILRHIIQIFSPTWRKQFKCLVFLLAEGLTITWKFGFSVNAQVAKLIWFCERSPLGASQLNCSLTDRDFQFRMRIIVGTILSWYLVFYIGVSDCSRNSSGECPYPRFKRNSSNLARAPRMGDSVLLNSWDSFNSEAAFNLLRNLRDVLLSKSGNGCALWLAVPMIFLCITTL